MQSILHIIPSYKPAFHYGGPTVSCARLAEEQVCRGAQVTVWTTTANGPEELPVPSGAQQEVDGVQVRYFRRRTGDHGHFSPALLLWVWRKARHFPVVHVHSWWNWVVFGALLICRLRGIRVLVSPHGMLSPYTLRSPFRRWFQKRIGHQLLKGNILHATSKMERGELQLLHPGIPVVLAPNIVYLPENKPARRENSPLQLFFLSRIDPKKGLDILFHALAPLKNLPWKLVIAGETGSAYHQFLKNLAALLDLTDKIEWIGWCSGEEKWRRLAQSDLLVLSSHNENFANVVIESLAVGTPVVISDQVGLRAYVRERELGWVAPPEATAFGAALQQAMADQGAREKINRLGPGFVAADFKPEKVVDLYFHHYQQLLLPR